MSFLDDVLKEVPETEGTGPEKKNEERKDESTGKEQKDEKDKVEGKPKKPMHSYSKEFEDVFGKRND